MWDIISFLKREQINEKIYILSKKKRRRKKKTAGKAAKIEPISNLDKKKLLRNTYKKSITNLAWKVCTT